MFDCWGNWGKRRRWNFDFVVSVVAEKMEKKGENFRFVFFVGLLKISGFCHNLDSVII